ncbi:MAG: hypothetical protein K6F20_01040 [Bacteroidaceae bacterium]|nr:hypothetical protein [Bacteroidaceae bacterium]
MKKVYIIPQTGVAFAEVTSMLAESLPISDETVDGGEALTKEEKSWDIWGDE